MSSPERTDNLLARLSTANTYIHRVRAEADNKYDTDDPMLNYLFDKYAFLEVLNEDTVYHLEKEAETWERTTTRGRLSYERKKEVIVRLLGEVAEFERWNNLPSAFEWMRLLEPLKGA
ncbi:MAG: hypothetical protein BGO39_18345 [Chloroflexi bacterium 54-19]|nr:MAG: hypothetical protein BGO39_18345 [Chloroflexi bacterium 54-19]